MEVISIMLDYNVYDIAMKNMPWNLGSEVPKLVFMAKFFPLVCI